MVKQRSKKKHGELPKDRIEVLDLLGFPWIPLLREMQNATWEKRFFEFKEYLNSYPKAKSDLLKMDRKCPRRIRNWCQMQKFLYAEGGLLIEREKALTVGGFSWVLK